MQPHHSFLILLVTVCVLDLCRAAPPETEISGHSGSTSFSSSSVNGIQVSLSQVDVDGECISKIKISGNGIYKKTESPCRGQEAPSVINLNKTVLVGDEWFSDTPGQLVHLKDGKCVLEVFTKEDDKYSSKEEAMGEEECEKVKVKIEVLKEEQKKWAEYVAQQAQQAQQQIQEQIQQIQQNLQKFQQNLFGNIFGFLG